MKIGFFSDPHLGLVRTANTTVSSRRRFREHLYDVALEAAAELKSRGADLILCLGDVFDSYSNTEEIIHQAAVLLEDVDLCLAGNHDVRNREDSLGSLQMLSNISPNSGIVISPHIDKPFAWSSGYTAGPSPDSGPSINIVMVPHAITQDLFCQSLELAEGMMKSGKNVLCLHCNVGVPGYSEEIAEGTTLYLTDEWQERLLQSFDYIFVGHEHVPRTLHDGRLVVLGNTYPLSFGELGTRYIYVLHTETMTVEAIPFGFSRKRDYLEIRADVLLGCTGDLDAGTANIVEVTGAVKRSDQADLARSIATFWKRNWSIFMFRNATDMEGVEKVERAGVIGQTRTLPEVVAEAVAKTPFQDAYKEAAAQVPVALEKE